MTPLVRSWQPVEFRSVGVTLRGRLYGEPRSSSLAPAVIMTHGFSATISGMVADLYAEAFAEAGLRVLLYDHVGLGISDGEPRSQVDPWLQARGYIDALDYLTSRSDIDPERVAIWGDSISAEEALVVTAVDKRVAALVMQVPSLGVEMGISSPDRGAFAEIRDRLRRADLGSVDRAASEARPVVSPDQLHMPSHLIPISAFRWFIQFGGRYGTGWQNRATYVEPVLPVALDATACAPHVEAPTLMVTAHHDEMPGADAGVARSHLRLFGGPAESLEIDGGHFGLLYPDTPEYVRSVETQRDFLVRHLGL